MGYLVTKGTFNPQPLLIQIQIQIRVSDVNGSLPLDLCACDDLGLVTFCGVLVIVLQNVYIYLE